MIDDEGACACLGCAYNDPFWSCKCLGHVYIDPFWSFETGLRYCTRACAEPAYVTIIDTPDGVCAMCKKDGDTPFVTRLGRFCGSNCAWKKYGRS